jgi:hypothetical protein
MIRYLLFACLFALLTAEVSCKKPAPEAAIENHMARLGKILGQDLMPGKTNFQFLKTESSEAKLLTSAIVDSMEVRVQDLGIGVRGVILGDERAKNFSYYGWLVEGDRLKLGITDINQDVRSYRVYYWSIN